MASRDLQRVVIGHGEFDHVTIEVTNQLGEGWFGADVTVACRIWSGAVHWQVRKGELRHFAEELEKVHETLSGTATLTPSEPNLKLRMTGDGKGHIAVNGEATDQFGSGTYLIFRLELDQSELPAIVKSLSAADP